MTGRLCQQGSNSFIAQIVSNHQIYIENPCWAGHNILAFISEYQIKFDHGRYAKLHGVGKISLRSSSSCVADSLFFILRNLLEMMLGHTCECDAQPPHHCQALFLDLLHPQLLLSQSLHQECPQQNHPNSCLWPSCLSSNFDRKISCSCYISSFCLLPPPSLLGV